MKYALDLHIHSALSPCCQNEMTPNNIVNMAILKGLDIIAVTDHNSAENLAAVQECARGTGLLVVPGMEIMTAEEVHLICLFPDVKSALSVQAEVYRALPPIDNREDIFGQQLVMDENDNITGVVDRLLISAANLMLEEAAEIVEGVGGVVIPAHIDRESYSILSNLGIIPVKPVFKFLEISKECNPYEYRMSRPMLDGYRLLRSSDAHCLGNILERESFIELEELSTECLLKNLMP
jgi:hypothetical protein